jgi:hypothetical protein
MGNPDTPTAPDVRFDHGGWISGPGLPLEASDLAELRRAYPEWAIWYSYDDGVWIALSWPTQTSEHILCAYDLPALRCKLDRAK